jgi:uncharacterized membrane protein YtjA (UPF0391 family)
MVRWTAGFLAIAMVAALVALTDVDREAAFIGRWVFCVGLVLAGFSLLHGPRTVVV